MYEVPGGGQSPQLSADSDRQITADLLGGHSEYFCLQLIMWEIGSRE